MTEQCPLPVTTAYEDGVDEKGLLWDTGIPYECWSCINKALAHSGVQTEHFQPEVFEGEDPEMMDLWKAVGIRRKNASPARLAVEEVGIDDDGNNESGLLNRSAVSFICPKD